MILNLERTRANQRLFWWKANRCGYTADPEEAGHYSEEEVREICKDPDDVPILTDDPMDEATLEDLQ